MGCGGVLFGGGRGLWGGEGGVGKWSILSVAEAKVYWAGGPGRPVGLRRPFIQVARGGGTAAPFGKRGPRTMFVLLWWVNLFGPALAQPPASRLLLKILKGLTGRVRKLAFGIDLVTIYVFAPVRTFSHRCELFRKMVVFRRPSRVSHRCELFRTGANFFEKW